MSRAHLCPLFFLACLLGSILTSAGAVATEPTPPADQATTPTAPLLDNLPPSALLRLGRARFLQGGTIVVLRYSPDGKMLATVDGGGAILIWDCLTGRELHYIPLPPALRGGFGPPLDKLAFTSDSKRLVACGRVGVRVHELATGELVYKFPTDPLRGAEMSLSADGRRLVVRESCMKAGVGKDGLGQSVPDPRIRVYDLATGEKDEALTGRLAGYGDAIFSPDGRVLAAVALEDKTWCPRQVDFLDVRAEKKLGKIDLPGKQPIVLLFSPDGSRFVTGGEEGLRAWTAPDAKLVGKVSEEALPGLAGPPCLIDNDRFVSLACTASRAVDGTVRLCQFSTGKELWRTKPLGPGICIPFAVSPDGKVLTTGHMLLRHYELSTGQDRLETVTAGGPLAFSSSGKLLAYTPPAEYFWREAPIIVTEWKAGKSQTLAGHPKPVFSLAFTADDAALVSAGADKCLRGWATKTGKELWQVPDGPDSYGFRYSPKRGWVAFSKADKTIGLFDASAGKQLPALRSRTEDVLYTWHSLTFSEDGKFLAAARVAMSSNVGKNGLSVWDLSTNKEVALIEPKEAHHIRGLYALALSPDGKSLAGANEGRLCVWDVATGAERVWARPNYEFRFEAVAFSPDGKHLAVGDCEGRVTVWDVKTEKFIQAFEGHHAPVAALAWAPDGTLLASSATDASALLWDVTGKAPAPAKPKPPTPAQRQAALDKAWEDLASPSAQAAYRAMLALAADPKEGVALLKERLRPPAAPAAGDIAGLIAGLGDDAKAKADGAERALAAYGEAVRDPLRRAPANKPSAEALRRVERLLAGLDDPAQCPEALRVLRAVELLEYLGTPDAIAVLRALAREAVRKPEKADAARALERLGKRKATAKE